MATLIMLAGPDASVTFPSGAPTAHFNSFSYSVSLSSMESAGFGDLDAVTRGGVRRAGGVLSGTTSSGATETVSGGQTALFGHAGLVSLPASITLTMKAACTLTFFAVFTGINLSVQLESYDQTTISYVRSGPTTETWTSTGSATNGLYT